MPGFGPGRNTEQRAMGEGFGDFLAAYTYLAGRQRRPTRPTRRFCVGEWDAVSYNPVRRNPGSGCLRWVDGTNEDNGSDIGTYSGTPTEEHDDGRYWSAMLTCVFDGIEPSLGTAQARDRMLTLVLAHHFDLMPTAANTAFARLARRAARGGRQRASTATRSASSTRAASSASARPRRPTPPPRCVNGTLTPAAPDGANGWYRTAPTVTGPSTDPESRHVDNGCQDGADARRHGRQDDQLHA